MSESKLEVAKLASLSEASSRLIGEIRNFQFVAQQVLEVPLDEQALEDRALWILIESLTEKIDRVELLDALRHHIDQRFPFKREGEP